MIVWGRESVMVGRESSPLFLSSRKFRFVLVSCFWTFWILVSCILIILQECRGRCCGGLCEGVPVVQSSSPSSHQHRTYEENVRRRQEIDEVVRRRRSRENSFLRGPSHERRGVSFFPRACSRTRIYEFVSLINVFANLNVV